MHSPNAEPRAREREKEGENKREKERTERESRNSGTLSDRWKRNESESSEEKRGLAGSLGALYAESLVFLLRQMLNLRY